MLRIDKRSIHFNKIGYVVLKSIYGIGNSTSAHIWNYLGVNLGYFVSESKFDSEHFIFISLSRLFTTIEFFLGLSVRKQCRSDLEILKKIKAYRGIRFFLGLPIRGQRRHTNARTARTRRDMVRKRSKVSTNLKLKSNFYKKYM